MERKYTMRDLNNWKPRPFTPLELEGIDPVILLYMKDVDQTMIIESLRRTPHERVAGLEAMMEGVERLREAGQEARHARHAI